MTHASTITVVPSGRVFATQGDETILAAAIRQGIGLPYGCKDGACGSCKCKKIAGTVVHGPHQDKALSAEEEAAGYLLTCSAVPQGDVTIESKQVAQAGAFPIKKMPARVVALDRLSPDVMRVKLQLPANDALQYHAGQYIEFILKDGQRRAYSMATAPNLLLQAPAEGAAPVPMLELHIRHMAGGAFTDHVFGAMKSKDLLRVEGPFGGFFLREDSAKPIVLLASGTGFAPIKAVLEHMRHKGITRPTVLYWGGRRPSDMYLDAWLKTQLAAMPHLRYVPVVSDALPEDGWTGRTGFVHRAVLQDFPDLSGHQVYACGAPIVIESARRDYAQAGLPEAEFYADSFVSEADKHRATASATRMPSTAADKMPPA